MAEFIARMAQVIEYAGLNDHGVLLEYQLPLTSKRLDCLVCGNNGDGAQQAVIVELKQWDKCVPSEAEKLVRSWVGGRQRELLHPSVQAGQYLQYLEDTQLRLLRGQLANSLECVFVPAQLRPMMTRFARRNLPRRLFDADGGVVRPSTAFSSLTSLSAPIHAT